MLEGSLEAWLPHFRDIEDRLFRAVEAAWPVCVGPLQSRKDTLSHEDDITEHLVRCLIRTKQQLPGRIHYQHTLLEEADDGHVSMSSNIDFVLTVGDDEDVYLACECKRLNVPYAKGVRGLFGPYVDDGLMRFITGQYSRGLPLAMMIGYVMNSRTDHARRGVSRVMAIRSAVIGLRSERDGPSEGARAVRFHTTHACADARSIEIAHTLLSWP